MQFLNKILFGSICVAVLFACNQENKTSTASEKEKSAAGDSASAPKENTSIAFEETHHDFGTINKGDMVTHVFKFKNNGTSPLVIFEAKASCGCTVPQWTKEPVAPGEGGEIEVKYNGSGSGQIQKTVTVYANTDPKETVLNIAANVRPIDLENKGPLKK